MAQQSISRRKALQGAGATAAAMALAPRVLAQAPPAEAITPALVEAAAKEGRVNLYTAMEIAMAEQYSKIFEAKFPGISVRVERSGAERIFSRISQEYASRIFNVDLVNTTDAAHALAWKPRAGSPPICRRTRPSTLLAGHIDPDGTFATLRILFSVIAYNTQLVKPQDAPTGFVDLLDPEMDGQAGEGASGLLRPDPHRHACHGARCSAGATSRSSPSRR